VNDLVRAFLSINIDDQLLLSHIGQLQQRLDQKAAKMKLIEINNIHFTLRFFGDTPLDKIGKIREHLEKIEVEPFDIRIAGVGAFPNKRRPRIVWIGVTKNGQQVRELKMEIDLLLKDVGYQSEKRKYTPHATIARVRNISDSNRIAVNLDELANEPIGSMSVSGFTMMKSTLTPTGPIYDTMWRIP
jgi:2'-5' RNA ligase